MRKITSYKHDLRLIQVVHCCHLLQQLLLTTTSKHAQHINLHMMDPEFQQLTISNVPLLHKLLDCFTEFLCSLFLSFSSFSANFPFCSMLSTKLNVKSLLSHHAQI